MNNTMTEVFGEPISIYSRQQALADGVLIDVTREASSETGIIGGFKVPVALTSAVWHDIQSIPPHLRGIQDQRGRLHDLLWMCLLAARRGGGSEVTFAVIMDVDGETDTERIYRAVCGPDDDGTACVTILCPDEA